MAIKLAANNNGHDIDCLASYTDQWNGSSLIRNFLPVGWCCPGGRLQRDGSASLLLGRTGHWYDW